MDSRRDGGDGLTGSGLELGGGVRFESGRLKGSIEARWLATHSASSLEESSLSATLQLKPRSSGQGLSASLTPSWGDANSAGIEHAWQQSALTLIPTPSDQSIPWSLQSRLGYGLAIPHSPAVLTPFMELNQDDHHTRQRLGMALQFSSSSTLAIEMGVRRDQTSAATTRHSSRTETATAVLKQPARKPKPRRIWFQLKVTGVLPNSKPAGLRTSH